MDYTGVFVEQNDIPIEALLTKENLEKAQAICFADRPITFHSIPDSGTWGNIFRTHISFGVRRLERLLDRHSGTIDSRLIGAIHDLIERGYFSSYAYSKPVKDKSKDPTLPYCLVGQAIGVHKKYLEMVDNVIKANHQQNVYIR